MNDNRINYRNYHPNIRENDPVYLLYHIEQLLEIAKEFKNSSSLIYACLDARITLELLDLKLILASVKPEERAQIIEDSKPKNGIERMNQKTGSLKERYQLFFESVCEVLNVDAKCYNYKKSKELQHKLSTYIHSYYMTEEEINFESKVMQRAFTLISEVENFVKGSLAFEGDAYSILGIEIKSIPDEDKILLDEWKNNQKMDVNELKGKLKNNQINRKNI
ncbi:hypothetical protein [Pontibacter beigongshangensis]|uniref:hypothetical protein n=1 Tax=Pontibacter beigongshangensis TaxID=2574733 RepID=UPI00164F8CF9|nr:hypothetical protein [Pontibacter beigongshangensis]